MANIDEFNDDAELVGLMADPNKADPVSGNKIPLGATAEGVRDDQTAAISPGEFVIPDYAVRYHGLDFYVGSLQKAKKGLGQMEGMGLVGNPDEQTIPDETPLPDMEDEDQEFQIGGLATAGLPQTPQQQPIPTTPLPQSPAIQPIRPVSTQPVPAPVAPVAPLGLNTTPYQQGYYKEVSPGQYQFFGPPGTASTQGLVTLDQIANPSLVAPQGTNYSDIFGPQATISKTGTPQSQYLQFQGPAAGLPGGYKIDPFINDVGNVIYLTTIGGQVQGGAPPGYRKASPEDLGQTRREAPLQAPVVRPRRQPPTSGGAGPVDTSEQFGAVSTEDVDTSYSFSPEYEGPDTLGELQSTRWSGPPPSDADKVAASYKAVGLTAPLDFGPKDALSAIPGVGAAMGIAAFGGHSKQPSIAAHQAANGMRGSFNVGNISVHSIGTPFGVNMTVAYDAANPSRTVAPAFAEAMRGSLFGVNTYDKAFSVDKYDFDDQGTAVGKGRNPTFSAQFSYDSKTGQLAKDGKGDTPGFGGTNSKGQGVDAYGSVSATIGANQMQSMTPQAQVEHGARRNGVDQYGVKDQKGFFGVANSSYSNEGSKARDAVNDTIGYHGGIQETKDAAQAEIDEGILGPAGTFSTPTQNAANAINAAEESEAADAEGSSGVICSELRRLNILDKDLAAAEGRHAYSLSDQIANGYHFWSIPFVKLMRRNKLIFNIGKFGGINWAKYAAHKAQPKDFPPSLIGSSINFIGIPICFILGFFVKQRDYTVLSENKVDA